MWQSVCMHIGCKRQTLSRPDDLIMTGKEFFFWEVHLGYFSLLT